MQPLASYRKPGPPTPGVKSNADSPAQKATPKRHGKGTPRRGTPGSNSRIRHTSRKTAASKSRFTPLRKVRDTENEGAKVGSLLKFILGNTVGDLSLQGESREDTFLH